MTAMDEGIGDDGERRRPAETMEFSLVNRVNAVGRRLASAEEDEQKTTSTPQMSFHDNDGASHNWQPFP